MAKILFFSENSYGLVGGKGYAEQDVLGASHEVRRSKGYVSLEQLADIDAVVVNMDTQGTFNNQECPGMDFLCENRQALKESGVPVILTTEMLDFARGYEEFLPDAGVVACVGLGVSSGGRWERPKVYCAQHLLDAVEKYGRHAKRNDPAAQACAETQPKP